jgi:hypothetical protein
MIILKSIEITQQKNGFRTKLKLYFGTMIMHPINGNGLKDFLTLIPKLQLSIIMTHIVSLLTKPNLKNLKSIIRKWEKKKR